MGKLLKKVVLGKNNSTIPVMLGEHVGSPQQFFFNPHISTSTNRHID